MSLNWIPGQSNVCVHLLEAIPSRGHTWGLGWDLGKVMVRAHHLALSVLYLLQLQAWKESVVCAIHAVFPSDWGSYGCSVPKITLLRVTPTMALYSADARRQYCSNITNKVSILHIYWNILWHSIQHTVWHSIWHKFSHSICQFLGHSDILSGIHSSHVPAFYLAYILAFYLDLSDLAYIRAFYVAYFLTFL